MDSWTLEFLISGKTEETKAVQVLPTEHKRSPEESEMCGKYITGKIEKMYDSYGQKVETENDVTMPGKLTIQPIMM